MSEIGHANHLSNLSNVKIRQENVALFASDAFVAMPLACEHCVPLLHAGPADGAALIGRPSRTLCRWMKILLLKGRWLRRMRSSLAQDPCAKTGKHPVAIREALPHSRPADRMTLPVI